MSQRRPLKGTEPTIAAHVVTPLAPTARYPPTDPADTANHRLRADHRRPRRTPSRPAVLAARGRHTGSPPRFEVGRPARSPGPPGRRARPGDTAMRPSHRR